VEILRGRRKEELGIRNQGLDRTFTLIYSPVSYFLLIISSGPNGFEFEVFREKFDKLNQYYSLIKKESLI
jgi:hypothetical protein